jgi:hypothetical protein
MKVSTQFHATVASTWERVHGTDWTGCWTSSIVAPDEVGMEESPVQLLGIESVILIVANTFIDRYSLR